MPDQPLSRYRQTGLHHKQKKKISSLRKTVVAIGDVLMLERDRLSVKIHRTAIFTVPLAEPSKSKDVKQRRAVYHKEAAASTAPAALNVFELDTTTSTGYCHSIYLAQAILGSVRAPPLSRGPTLLTPVCTFPPEIFTHVRNQHHGQQ